MLGAAVERIRAFAASADGSLLDDQTWNYRHLRISMVNWGLGLFSVVFTFTNPQHQDQALYAAATIVVSVLAAIPRLPRRWREAFVSLAFVLEQVYLLRFVGNFTLAPLTIVLLTFYQDWAPIVLSCAINIGLVLLSWFDAAYFNGSTGFRVEIPHTGMTLRVAAILGDAVLALAIWRSGTQASRDQLTGRMSRAGAERALDHELSRARRPAVWVCDIDNFRDVVNNLGPEAGDRLLQQLGARLNRIARSRSQSWFCARLGGDTFAIVGRHVPDTAFIKTFAEGLEAEASLSAHGIDTHDVPVHFSVGAAAAIVGERGTGLIQAAERNMRDAKGRGAVRVVVDQRIDRALGRTEPLMTARLYRACAADELEMYLQPIVQLADGLPVGAEALLRWNHPERGLMLPGEFLPQAERDSALMEAVSRAAGTKFGKIIADLASKHGGSWLSYGCSFNLAAIRLRDPLLVQGLETLMELSGARASGAQVYLEITEGALMDIESEAPEVLSVLSERGYLIALDDFGTGHSSLAHLRDFPLDTVKIDQTFIRLMNRSTTDRAVVQAIADIASASGVKVVAEGVETEEQRQILLAIKPDILAQGWLYAKAMSVTDFEAWVLDRGCPVVV